MKKIIFPSKKWDEEENKQIEMENFYDEMKEMFEKHVDDDA